MQLICLLALLPYSTVHTPRIFSVLGMARDAVCTCADMPVGCAALQHCASYGQGRYVHVQLIGLSAVLLLSTAHTLPLSSLCLVWAGMLCAHVLICVLAVLPCSTVPRMAKGAVCMYSS